MNSLKIIKIEQKFNDSKIDNIPQTICDEFKRIQFEKLIKPGMNIGITVGSRGIDNIQIIIKSLIEEIKKREGIPFIINAMGSHGGATAKGQIEILASYGITEESMGVPIRATMDVVEIGQLKNGLPVYFNKIAYQADGIITVNRIKVHTAFKSKIESGLLKMLSVGLGNHEGAQLVHSMGVEGLRDFMYEAAKIILDKIPIIAGLGILENSYDETYKIVACESKDIEKVEAKLLKECKELLPKLPVNDVDVLYIQEIGKNISGTGMDTNVVGGVKDYDPAEYQPPKITRILAGDLTFETHGNALGVGLAHLITKRLYNKIDFEITKKNTITATFLDRSRIPIVVENDKEAFGVALRTAWILPGSDPRIIIIKNTLRMDEMFVSKSIWEEIKNKKNIKAIGEIEELTFNEKGNLINIIC